MGLAFNHIHLKSSTMSGNAQFSVKSANKSRFPPGALFALIGVNQLNPLMTLYRSLALLSVCPAPISSLFISASERAREEERELELESEISRGSCVSLLQFSRNMGDNSRSVLVEYAEDMGRQRDFPVNQQTGQIAAPCHLLTVIDFLREGS